MSGKHAVPLDTTGLHPGDPDENDSCYREDDGKNALHDRTSRANTPSPAAAGNSTMLSVTRSRSGRRNANRMARILLASGRIPHNNPSHGAGIASDSNFLAGGTSSFDHNVMLSGS